MKRILGAALLLAGATACGGGNPIHEYIIDLTGAQVTSSSNAKCPASPDTTQDQRTDFFGDGHILVYQGDGSNYYAELGGKSMQGTYTGGTYSFKYTFSDVNTDGASPPKYQTTEDATLTLSFKDDGTSGSYNYDYIFRCDTLNNSPAQTCVDILNAHNGGLNGNNEECVTTANVSAIKLPDPKYYQFTSP